MSQSAGENVISGYVQVLPSSKEASSDTDDDDDDDDDSWLDFQEMSAVADGAQFIRYSKPKEQTVTLSTVDGKEQYLFVGRLVLFDPWWIVSSRFVKKRNTFYGRGFPGYELRQDPVVCRHRLVHQFLTASTRVDQNNDPMVDKLLDYIKESGVDDCLTFDMLEDIIKEFCSGDEKQLKYMNDIIWKSYNGKIVRFAMKCPRLFKMASKLLPCYLLKLTTSDYDEDKLAGLDEANVSSPWVFGFKQILSREYDLTGMEANISMFETSGIISEVPVIQRDALYIYNALKMDAKQRGHIFFPLQKLKYSERYFKNYVVRNWKKAVEYLEASYVVRIESEGKRQNLFLYSNWKAEKDVADGLEELLVNGTINPPNWEVDFSSDDFDQIRKDVDQWQAAHVVCNSPITVLSGKGGCGKTTVVTKTLEHICKHSGQLPCFHSLSTFCERQQDDDLIDTQEESFVKTCCDVTTQTTSSDETSDLHTLSDTIHGSQILLTAPTGKAANLLGRKANLKSCTLHSVIMSYKMHTIEVQKRKKRNEEAPVWTHSDKTVLVVDECSLVSVGTFSTVLNILLSKCNLKKIILLGDVRQLPSIEPGNFLTDIFQLFQYLRFGVELGTNHRAESKLIIDNATLISNQQYPQIDSTKRFHLLVPEVEDDQNRDMLVRKLLKNSVDLEDDVTSQFVSFRKRDCEAVNEICCRHYNSHSLKNAKNKLEFRVGDKVCMTKNGSITNHVSRLMEIKTQTHLNDTFLTPETKTQSPARSVNTNNCNITSEENQLTSDICNGLESNTAVKKPEVTTKKPVRNRGYVFGEDAKVGVVETKNKACQTATSSDVKLSNGEVFVITNDVVEEVQEKSTRFLTLSDKDKDQEKIVCAKYHDLRRECKMKHAWARTIHTYQGSESNIVVYVLGNCGYQMWKHVYTAVTRGRKAVYIVGSSDRLYQAVKHEDEMRRTSLRDKLHECLLKQKQSVMTCQERVLSSLNSIKNSNQNNEMSPTETNQFDSDDSWVKEVDNTTYGLELEDFETLFPSQQPPPCIPAFENSDDSWIKQVDTTYGLELEEFETLFPSQQPPLCIPAFQNSDDSWIKHVDTTYGLELEEFEELFPSQQTKPFVDEEMQRSMISDDHRVSSEFCSDVEETKLVKRQASRASSETSPVKSIKTSEKLSPVRHTFRSLKLDSSSPDDK